MKYSKFMVPFLLLVVAALSTLCIYQQRIIAQQSFEIRWLLANHR